MANPTNEATAKDRAAAQVRATVTVLGRAAVPTTLGRVSELLYKAIVCTAAVGPANFPAGDRRRVRGKLATIREAIDRLDAAFAE